MPVSSLVWRRHNAVPNTTVALPSLCLTTLFTTPSCTVWKACGPEATIIAHSLSGKPRVTYTRSELTLICLFEARTYPKWWPDISCDAFRFGDIVQPLDLRRVEFDDLSILLDPGRSYRLGEHDMALRHCSALATSGHPNDHLTNLDS